MMFGGLFIQNGALVYYYTAVIGSRDLSITVASIMSIVPVFANVLVPFFARKIKSARCSNCLPASRFWGCSSSGHRV